MFVRRQIDIAVKLASGTQTNQPTTFADGRDVVSITGARASVRVQNSGGLAGSEAQVSVWGLLPSLIRQLETLGMAIQGIAGNTITIAAGDVGTPLTNVFIGTILQAYADYQSAPDVPFRFECRAGAAEAVIPYPASSFTGAADVSVILSTIARANGWGFENSGVDVKLASPYFAGSAWEQVKQVEEAARINAQLINNVLCIWPRYGSRTVLGAPTPVGPPPDGQMIGYPNFTAQGIMLRTIFDRRITFGSQIKVTSSIFTQQSLGRIGNLSSVWNVSKLDLALDAEMPKGQWQSTILAYNPGGAQPLPPRTTGR